MLNIQEVFSFVSVAKEGSFTKASTKTGQPKSTISRHVQNLEERLALNLFQRTTRRLELTAAGEDFFRQSEKLISDFENLEHSFLSQNPKIEGTLRITCPVEVGVCLLPEKIQSFQVKHPDVEFELILDDSQLDLIASKIDLALRGGSLKDSSMISKKHLTSEFRLYCSPSYLKANPNIDSKGGIQQAHFLDFTNRPIHKMIFTKAGQKLKIHPKITTVTNSLRMSMEMAKKGLGVCLLPNFMGEHESQHKKLTQVLEGWGSGMEPLQIIYPAQKHLSLKVREFINHLSY